MGGRLWVGTSGFAYREWIGSFYPPGTRSADMLPFYAATFPSVEVNYTFRRTPAAATLSTWVAATPDGFVFACKAHMGITHHARLAGAGDRLRRFFDALAPLGERRGPVLFQCPPNLRHDPGVLDEFLGALGALGGPHRYAMEFRHPSFDTDEVRAALAEAGVAWCVADTEEAPASFIRTAPGFAYVRLRGGAYEAAARERWAADFAAALDAGADVYCYLKHEGSAAGPREAAALRTLVEGRG